MLFTQNDKMIADRNYWDCIDDGLIISAFLNDPSKARRRVPVISRRRQIPANKMKACHFCATHH